MNCFAAITGLMNSAYTTIDMVSNHVGNIFTDDEPVSFQIRTTADTSLSVADYDGKEVFRAEVAAGESTVEVGILPRGHYTINIQGEDEEIYFGVIPSLGNRPQIEDSCIAADVAMSWLVEPDKFDDLARLTRLAGIIWSRDRVHWTEIETQRGNWPERTKYNSSAEIQTKHGLKVYQVFHGTPAWAQKEAEGHSFPDDMRDAFNFAAETARRFAGKVVAWEVWNEPDISVFSVELGDSYSALLKAMYLGYKSVDPNLPVLLCSFAMPPGKFTELVLQNDVNDYYDIYNYHIYGDWQSHTDRALAHIEVMRSYGAERKPVWLTEAGRPITREPDMVELTPEQGRDVANFLPKAIVSSLSAGVDKYFWFIMPYFRERDKALFGLLREDMTPTAGYCSLAACTYALGKADYLGKVDSDDVHAHVFQRGDGSLAVAFWTDDGKKTLKIQASVKKATLVDLMGVEQELNVSGSVLEVEAAPSVRYLILDSVSLMSNMRMGYPREKTEIKTYDPENVSHVVLRLQFPRECRDKKLETYLLPVDSSTKVSVELCNFGENEFSGKLRLQLPEGYQGTLDDEAVSIAPMGRVVKDFELLPDSGASSEPGQIRIDVMDVSGETEAFILAWIATKPNEIQD